MTEGQRSSYIKSGFLAQNFGFELIESVLTDHAEFIIAHPEQVEILRSRLLPFVLKILAEKASFAVNVRVMRLTELIISRMLPALSAECEVALALLNGMLGPATNLWKRALALEVFHNIHANADLTRSVYERFDEKVEKKNIICDHLGALVRLAAEKPAVIGLGSQSWSSSKSNGDNVEQISQASEGVGGSMALAAGMSESESVGLSTRWSMMRVPCIESIDKAEPPDIPATYIYALALTCLNSFSDGLAKFLLPLTAPYEAKAKRKQRIAQENGNRPVEDQDDSGQSTQPSERIKLSTRGRSMRSRKDSINPLSLQDHLLYRQICTTAHMVEHCWPALLAAYSTFLSAALDTDYFHGLIRSFQKFTQVAGLLDYMTPRDAFLTTLGKYSVPASRASGNKVARESLDQGLRRDSLDEKQADSGLTASVGSPKSKSVVDQGSPTISSRNLLALRALLNLGIALGPSLRNSWSIILETLQQVELLLSYGGATSERTQPSRQPSRGQLEQNSFDRTTNGADFSLELAAAQTTATRMLESTTDFPDGAFLVFTQCLLRLLHGFSSNTDDSAIDPASNLLSPQTPLRKHQRFPSVIEKAPDEQRQQENLFALDKLHNLIKCNQGRLSNAEEANSGWELLSRELITVMSCQAEDPSVRIKASKTFIDLMVTTAVSTEPELETQHLARARAISAIEEAIIAVYKDDQTVARKSRNCNEEMHMFLLEAVRSILEHCGESLSSGWDTIFTNLMTPFDRSINGVNKDALSVVRINSAKLVRSSFGSLQLICSDYLQSVPLACLPTLIDTLYLFCSQDLDLNISLTVRCSTHIYFDQTN